jgi:hypothetical protein
MWSINYYKKSFDNHLTPFQTATGRTTAGAILQTGISESGSHSHSHTLNNNHHTAQFTVLSCDHFVFSHCCSYGLVRAFGFAGFPFPFCRPLRAILASKTMSQPYRHSDKLLRLRSKKLPLQQHCSY